MNTSNQNRPQPVGQLMTKPQQGEPSSKRGTTSEAAGLSDDAERALAAVWSEFTALWPGYWPKYAGEVGGATYQAWQRTLGGLGANQITRGLQAVRSGGHKWPPAAPEFRRLCAPTPEALGVPGPLDAFARAQARRWEPAVVWHAVQRWREAGAGDMADLRAMAEPDQTWQRVYAGLLREIDDGAVFERPQPVGPALPSQPEHVDPSMDPAEAREAFFSRFGRRRSGDSGDAQGNA